MMTNFEKIVDQHPILLVISNLRGQIVQCSAWAKHVLEVDVGDAIQEVFYARDAQTVVEQLQACEPILGEIFRIELEDERVLHMRCTVQSQEDGYSWHFEDVTELVHTQQRLQALKVLPKEYGHEMNNFLTVIGSAAEGLKQDVLDDTQREDAEAILSITDRAALLTRQFMQLGRKSLLPNELIDLSAWVQTECAMLARLAGLSEIALNIASSNSTVYATTHLLRNALISTVLAFDTSITIAVESLLVSYHFSSHALGLTSGRYVVLSVYEDGFAYSNQEVVSTRRLVDREQVELQGAWEVLTRCRGGLCQHENDAGQKCVSLFFPWILSTKA